MSPTPLTQGPARPAAAVNEDIRALMHRAGGLLWPQDRPLYERLLAEWVDASMAERSRGPSVLPAVAPAA